MLARITCRIALAAAAIMPGVAPLDAQNTYTDLEGRFAVDLPNGIQLSSQQTDLWVFTGTGTPAVIVHFMRGETDRQAAFERAAAIMLQANGYPMPPKDSLRDAEISGNPARRAVYAAPITVGAQAITMNIFIGAAVLEGGEGAIGFASFVGPQQGQHADGISRAFDSIRLPGAKASGAQNLRVAVVTLADTGANVFRHALMQATVPAGWKVEPGSGAILANLIHAAYGRITLMGLPKNDLGKDAASIIAGLQQGLQGTLGSMAASGQPYDVTADNGATFRAADFTGVITAGGTNIAQGVTVAGFKDPARGLGVMAFYPASATAGAKEAILAVIKSIR